MAALRHPINGIELDLRLTSDAVPVVCHDGDLRRFGCRGAAISQQRLSDLRRHDIGRWFGRRFIGERIVTLPELLKVVGARTTLLLEIKSMTGKAGIAITRRLCRATVQELRRTRMTQRVFILCFDESVLLLLRRLDPRLRCVRNIDHLPRRFEPWLDRQARHGMFGVDCNQRHLGNGRAFVDAAHARGLNVFTYTCNDRGAVRRALAAGVDSVLGDDPAWLLKTVRSFQR